MGDLDIVKINRYNEISRNLNKQKVSQHPTAFIPSPTEKDYKRGYIVRYFTQSANNSSMPIIEVKNSGYAKFTANPFFKTVKLDWRLIGNEDEVKKSNKTSIRLASKRIPRIKLYLPNRLQFHKKS